MFVLVPMMMILHKTSGTSTIDRDELAARVDAFVQGRWRELLEEALRHTQPSSSHILTEEEEKRGQEKGPERSSFQSKACAHRVSSSSKEQHNIRFVAREKTSGAGQGDPTRGVDVHSRRSLPGIDKGNHDSFAKNRRWSGIATGHLRLVLHFSSPCPHGQEWIVCCTHCGLPLIQLLEQPCCQKMALEHTCSAVPCWALLEEENLRGLLPFARYHWKDEDGCRKESGWMEFHLTWPTYLRCFKCH